MKITKVSLPSFRSSVGVELPTNAPRVFIAGVNGAGKSTIREAIKWALTGKCQGLDGKGAGIEVLAPTGEPTTATLVGLDVEGIGSLTRSANGGLRVQGFTGTSGSQQLALYDRLKTSDAFLSAVLDTSVFLGLAHADAKAFILGLLDVRIRLSPTDPKAYSLDELDDLYDGAYEARRDKKAELKRMGTLVAPAAVAHAKPEDIERQLGIRRQELQTLVAEVAKTIGERQALERQKFQCERPMSYPILAGTYAMDVDAVGFRAYVEHLADLIMDAEERLGVMEGDGLEEAIAPLLPPPEDDVEGRVEFFKGRAEALAAHTPSKGCVIDPDVPCETPKAKFTKRQKAILAEIGALGEQKPAQVKPSAPNPLTALRKTLDVLKADKAAVERFLETEAKRQADLERVVNELHALPDTYEKEQLADGLRGRITKGEGMLKDARAYWQAVEAYDKALASRSALEREIADLEQAVEALGPNGVRVQALGEAIGAFSLAVNTFLKPFGWEVGFTIDPWGVLVNGRPIETWSKSEQYRVGVGIQLAVATFSGLNFAVVDELDMLNQANRDTTVRLLYDAPLEQIFILSTREPSAPLPNISGFCCYRFALQDGRTVVVEQVAA